MASGVVGGSIAAAAQHAGPGQRCGGGGVNVPRLEQGATTALAWIPRQKTATLGNVQVQVGKCVYRVFTSIM